MLDTGRWAQRLCAVPQTNSTNLDCSIALWALLVASPVLPPPVPIHTPTRPAFPTARGHTPPGPHAHTLFEREVTDQDNSNPGPAATPPIWFSPLLLIRIHTFGSSTQVPRHTYIWADPLPPHLSPFTTQPLHQRLRHRRFTLLHPRFLVAHRTHPALKSYLVRPAAPFEHDHSDHNDTSNPQSSNSNTLSRL
ncbi:hypothetical protein S40285_10175 [Stachybotrys chlorohalonatus IBT 40285]|uniref:Uncharacterized protein n=1 Tax=Stachybotrys chlorohalonatus (strain IBT 40285) TaxID=1283841 RepID=A0A084QI29_STAC4|nr:hypothetical protein S40285_10175 [Stachybotrys chlorohalonata IBT 40285]